MFSVIISQPDSSGNIEETQKDSFTPPPLMSLDVPIKSQGDPTNVDPIQKESERKSISSTTSQDTSQEKSHAVSSVSHPDAPESRHQEFGYKQRMGNGMGDQGGSFNTLWTSPGKSKKFGKKTKWKQNTLQQFPPSQVGPQGIPSNMNNMAFSAAGNVNNPQVQNWQGASQLWQKGPQDPNQGPPFFGSTDQIAYQQGQFNQPSSMGSGNMAPCNVPPPNLAIPPNFPLMNIPPPNFPPPGQPFTPTPYPRPSLNVTRYPNAQQGLAPQQGHFVPNYPPPQVPFQSYNSPSQYNVSKTDESPSKRLYSQQEVIVKDTSPLKRSGGERRKSLSPAKPKKPTNLPANWKTATDPQGNIYYYHTLTR